MGRGSPTAIGYNISGTNNEIMYLVTSNEYYSDSMIVSSAIAVANISDMGGTTLVANVPALAIADYGSIWGLYMFKKEETGSDAIGSQAPDQLIFCGTKKGKGLAARFDIAIASNVATTAAL